MAFVLNIGTGEHYYTYPEEYRSQIKLFQTPAFALPNAVFKILDAIYRHQDNPEHNVKAERENTSDCSEVWNYTVKSPVLLQELIIREETREVSEKPKHSDDIPEFKTITEFQIKIGNLYTYRTTNQGIISYQAQLITGPAKQRWLNNVSDDLYKQIVAQNNEKVILLGDMVR